MTKIGTHQHVVAVVNMKPSHMGTFIVIILGASYTLKSATLELLGGVAWQPRNSYVKPYT